MVETNLTSKRVDWPDGATEQLQREYGAAGVTGDT